MVYGGPAEKRAPPRIRSSTVVYNYPLASAIMARAWKDGDAAVAPQINAQGVHMYPFDPTFPIAVQFFHYRGHPRVPSNRHEYYEVLYLQSGEILWEVENRQIPMHAGDLFVIGSSLMHTILEYRGARGSAVTLTFLPSLIRSASAPSDEVDYLSPFLAQGELFQHVIPAHTGVPARVLRLMVRIHAEVASRERLGPLAARTYLKVMLLLLAKYYAQRSGGSPMLPRNERDAARLRTLLEHVDRHYAERITLAEAARIVQLSKPGFVRFFKRAVGQPFIAYLNNIRVAKAQELLSSGKSIAQVSQEVGFCDQSYFGALFRKMVRLTPREYRRQLDVNGHSAGA